MHVVSMYYKTGGMKRMLRKKVKQFLAGLCTVAMLSQSIYDGGLFVLAAENGTAVTVSAGDVLQTETPDGDVSQADVSVDDAAQEEETDVSDGGAKGADVSTGEAIEQPVPEVQEPEEKVTVLDGWVTEGTSKVLYNGTVKYATLTEEGVLTISNTCPRVFAVDFFNGYASTDKDVKQQISDFKAQIVKIQFEEGAIVDVIGTLSFKDCTNLKVVDLTNDSSLTAIETSAFEGCSSLETLDFNTNLQYIWNSAFKGCAGLTSVTFKKELIRLGTSAFENCSKLEHIRIETGNIMCLNTTDKGANSAASNIFKGCNLKSFELAAKSDEASENGYNIVIPAHLFDGAGFDEETTIQIPYTIQEIGEGAFKNSNIKKIVFENETNKKSALAVIGKEAFYACKSLEAVEFHTNLQIIGESAFYQCWGLTGLVIPDSVTKIDKAAFKECKNIVDLTLSNSVATMGESAFESCTSLPSVTVPNGVPVSKAEFKGCTALTSVTLPNTLDKIEESAFENCIALPSIDLPAGITQIMKAAFKNCVMLREADVPDGVTAIGDNAFEACVKLQSNKLPQSLRTLGMQSYLKCGSFTEIIIPENVESIGKECFAACSIKKVTLQSKKMGTTSGTGIFNSCYITTIVWPEGIETIPVNLFNQATFETKTTVTIPKTVTTIATGAFGSAASGGKEVNAVAYVFEEGINLQVIGDNAFTNNTAITSFTIPDTVTTIGKQAFYGCKNLTSIIIPENVTSIGTQAFSNCSVLASITYNAIGVTTSNQNIFEKCNIRTITIGPNVEKFPDYLFYNAQFSEADELTGEPNYISLTIPASVERIGAHSLRNIVNLQQVTFASGSQLTEIGDYAFYSCKAMTACVLPDSVEKIGTNAFAGCSLLGSDNTKPFKLPASLVTLGSMAFTGCPYIKSANFGPYVTNEIPKQAFKDDTGLTTATFAGGLIKTIGESAFENCSSLAVIEIPSGVTTIGKWAFKGCTSLTKVVIPETVTSIDATAFEGCDFAQFYVVPGSKAEEILDQMGLLTRTTQLLKITYVLNDDGDKTTVNPNLGGYEAGDTTVFQAAQRNGYLFKGWYLDSKFTQPIAGVSGQDTALTVYAKWEIITYTITYELNGGTNNSKNVDSYTVVDLVKLENPTRLGFAFEGWFTDPEFTVKNKKTQIAKGSTGDITLYAKWKGNTAEAPTASIPSGSTVKAGTKVKLSTTAAGVNIYYTLDESTPTKSSAIYSEGIAITQNMTIKAFAAGEGYLDSEVATFKYYIADEAADWGDIAPEDRTPFADASKVPQGIWVAGVEDVDYTGAAITFADLRVYDNKTLLVMNTDYTVKYSNNKEAAKKDIGKKAPKVTVKAKGNYSGSAEVCFTINPINIEDDERFDTDSVISVDYTGKVQNKIVPVLWEGSRKMKNKKEYEVSYPSTGAGAYQNAGDYTIKLQGKGNYTGTKMVTLSIKNGTSVAKAKVKGVVAIEYGSPVEQNPTVTVGSATLAKGKDYEISYRNYENAGTAIMTITGVGSYCGSKQVTFKIKAKAKISKATISYTPSVTFTGSEIGKGALGIVVTYEGKTLTEDVGEGGDYTCTLQKNVNVGSGSIVLTGKGAFEGTVKKSFKITAADVSKLTLRVVDEYGDEQPADAAHASCAYVKGGVKPEVAVYNQFNKKLIPGTDYTVSYVKNNAVGTAEVTVKGKKNYAGTVSGKFAVTKGDMRDLVIIGSDVIYSKEAGAIATANVTVKDLNDKMLVADSDYSVKYKYQFDTTLGDGKTVAKAGTEVTEKQIIPEGTTIRIEVTGKGYYQETGVAYMRVIKSSIAKASVKVNAQEYTGSAVEPGMDQMTVMIGKVKLGANDYEIVDYSNNVKKGTAKVTIKGKNGYGGVKTVNFKITQKKFPAALSVPAMLSALSKLF